MWRQVFLSAVAHFTSTYNNPWAILTEKLLSVLQETWDTVYRDRIEHTVTVNGPIYHLVSAIRSSVSNSSNCY